MDLLKGNYKLAKGAPVAPESEDSSLTQRFEEATLSKVGGSICFVMKSDTFLWSGEEDEEKTPSGRD